MNRTNRFHRGLALALLCAVGLSAQAEMPLETTPSWESLPNGHFATGGAWIDVDGDGWLDMVVASGNDMDRQRLMIYHNNGDGTFPVEPTWSADDVDYHGHLDVGDINGDLWPDVAIAVYLGPDGFGHPGGAKVYLNTGTGAFSSTPDWTSAESFYCFSLALGDADGDGDLDLACACGEDYEDHPEHQRIFFNHGGTLETVASWQSDEIDYALDVFWGDIAGDGDMDVVFCGTSTPMRAYLNEQTAGGGIVTTASWESADLPQYGNTTALGDWNSDGFPEVAVADNDQLGGEGRFKVYANDHGILQTTPAWSSADGGYGSHVSWIDLDLDGDCDLAAGRWWGRARIYENLGGILGTEPDWSSTTISVIENMFWGDADNDGLRPHGLAIASGDGLRTHFALGQAPVRSVDEVRVDDLPLPPTAYAVHPANGWISISPPPPPGDGNVQIRYTYSVSLDLGVTNWDPGVGNYLFLNTGPSAVADSAAAALAMRVAPNPLMGRTMIRYRGEGGEQASLEILDVAGRLVRTLHAGLVPAGLVTWEWDRRDGDGRSVEGGVYFARLSMGGLSTTRRLIALR
jgi:hypothetical protein